MKDYQKALDSLSLGDYEEDTDSNEAKTKLLQELVDKEKPMKPIVEKTSPEVDSTYYGYGYKDDICPNCHTLLNRWCLEWNRDKYDYCPH